MEFLYWMSGLASVLGVVFSIGGLVSWYRVTREQRRIRELG